MLNVNTVYKQVLDLLNKNQIGGYLDETVFNSYAESSQLDWFNDAYARYESNQKNVDDIRVLRAKPKILTLDSNGEASYPSDYYHASNIWRPEVTNGRRSSIDIITDAELVQRLGSALEEVNESYPIAVLYDTYIQIYPTTIRRVELSYLRVPTAPNWAYTVTNGRKVYDSGNSTNFEVPDYAINDIVNRILTMASVEIRDQFTTQYGAANNDN